MLFMSDKEKANLLRTSLAAAIRRRREQCGLTQEELAFRCGLHRTYVSLVERSQKSLTIDSLARISDALDLKPSQLLKRAEHALEKGRADG